MMLFIVVNRASSICLIDFAMIKRIVLTIFLNNRLTMMKFTRRENNQSIINKNYWQWKTIMFSCFFIGEQRKIMIILQVMLTILFDLLSLGFRRIPVRFFSCF